MASESEIESFLKQLKEKIPVFEITFRQRQKNLQALADFNITAKQRIEQILDLNMKDYCSRPNKDSHVPGDPDYYVSGKTINGIEVYIKISIGRPQRMIDCISFHPSDHTLTYPLRT